MKLNVDGAVNLRKGFRGLGMVVRNCNGELMVAASKRVRGNFTPKATELMAAYWVYRWHLRWVTGLLF